MKYNEYLLKSAHTHCGVIYINQQELKEKPQTSVLRGPMEDEQVRAQSK